MVIVPEAVGLCSSRLGYFLGVDEVSGTPIALHEPPGSGHVDCIPRVTEPIVLKLDTRLVARRFTVPFDHHTVKASIAARIFMNHFTICGTLVGWYLVL